MLTPACWLPGVTTVKLYPCNEILSFNAHRDLYGPHREYSTYNQGLKHIFLHDQSWLKEYRTFLLSFGHGPCVDKVTTGTLPFIYKQWNRKVIEKLDICWLIIYSIWTILRPCVFIVSWSQRLSSYEEEALHLLVLKSRMSNRRNCSNVTVLPSVLNLVGYSHVA